MAHRGDTAGVADREGTTGMEDATLIPIHKKQARNECENIAPERSWQGAGSGPIRENAGDSGSPMHLSPLLFNCFLDRIVKEVMSVLGGGLHVEYSTGEDCSCLIETRLLLQPTSKTPCM